MHLNSFTFKVTMLRSKNSKAFELNGDTKYLSLTFEIINLPIEVYFGRPVHRQRICSGLNMIQVQSAQQNNSTKHRLFTEAELQMYL